jgi:hypothetical protein
MREDEVVAMLRGRRGFARTTWMTLRLQYPLLRLGDGLIGLSPRDVPGGREAIAKASRTVHAKLLWNQGEMDVPALLRLVARTGPNFKAWTPELLRSVLRHDSAFVLTVDRKVGLSIWAT